MLALCTLVLLFINANLAFLLIPSHNPPQKKTTKENKKGERKRNHRHRARKQNPKNLKLKTSRSVLIALASSSQKQ